MSEVSSCFYDAGSPECSKDSAHFKPAVAFEVHNEVTGIAGHYTFPEGMQASEYEAYKNFTANLFQYYESPRESGFAIVKKQEPDPALVSRMKDEWQRLLELNPVLETLKFDTDNPWLLFDAIAGVACLLNVDDINFFLELKATSERFDCMKLAYEIPDYAEMQRRIKDVAGDCSIDWVPSPGTQQKIYDQLSGRQSFVCTMPALKPSNIS